MGITSNTGLLACETKSQHGKRKIEPEPIIELRCEVLPAPFMLRPFAGLYNPFAQNCSVLCNHPTDAQVKEHVKRSKDSWVGGERHGVVEDLALDVFDKTRSPHDIVTEDMFRRYTETDSRPLTPAPTLASGKSRGSRRCLTPDEPGQRTAIVLDLRRSHSQETLYYHGHTTSDTTGGLTSVNDRSTLPSLNLSEANSRLTKGQCEQLPPLASPLVLSKRTAPVKETARTPKKTQLKALNIAKPSKTKAKSTESPQQPKPDIEINEAGDSAHTNINDDAVSVESRRRGKRRRKGRPTGSDRLTSAGLAAQAQQDPETQIAGIGTDSHNPSSRGSIAQASDDDVTPLPAAKPAVVTRKTDSFLDDEILKFLHREVDEESIETEFDVKRRYVLTEALRTRPEKQYNAELQTLLRELKVPAVCLGDWLHVPRVFSRQNAQFSLPIDSELLEHLTPMQYAARYVTMKKSKQLLYLTVLRKFRPEGYNMPIQNVEEGLTLMMGCSLSKEQLDSFKAIMRWDEFEDLEDNPEDIKVTLPNVNSRRKSGEAGDATESKTLKYRSWCGLCAICERMYGRYPSRDKDPPDGIELSDFTMIETRLAVLKVDRGLVQILDAIRLR